MPRFLIGTPCRPSSEKDIEIRTNLLRDFGFLSPGMGAYLELVGAIADFDYDFDRTLQTALPYADWFGALHCPFSRGNWLFEGLTDMSSQSGKFMALRCVDMARNLRIPKVVLHTDVIRERPYANGKELHAVQSRTRQHVKEVADYARGFGILLCVENMAVPGAFRPEGEEHFELMEYDRISQLCCDAVVGGYAITFDTCHAATNKPNIASQLRGNSDVIEHIHLSDTCRDDGYLAEGIAPVDPDSIIGKREWKEFLSAIPDGMTVTLEINEADVAIPLNTRRALTWLLTQVEAV